MKEITEKQGHEYCKKAIELETVVRTTYINMAEMLYNIRQEKLFEPFWSSWSEFCMEFKDLSEGTISKIISIYEFFVLKHGFTPKQLAEAGGWSKLYEVLRVAQNGSRKEVKEWIGKCATLTQKDLREEVLEAKTGVSIMKCGHEDTYIIRVCRKCGTRIQEHDEKNS